MKRLLIVLLGAGLTSCATDRNKSAHAVPIYVIHNAPVAHASHGNAIAARELRIRNIELERALHEAQLNPHEQSNTTVVHAVQQTAAPVSTWSYTPEPYNQWHFSSYSYGHRPYGYGNYGYWPRNYYYAPQWSYTPFYHVPRDPNRWQVPSGSWSYAPQASMPRGPSSPIPPPGNWNYAPHARMPRTPNALTVPSGSWSYSAPSHTPRAPNLPDVRGSWSYRPPR